MALLISQFVTQANDPPSVAIRYLTNSQISHVDLVLPYSVTVKGLNYPAGWLLGARLVGGVAIRHPGYENFSATVTVGCDVPNLDAGIEFALAQVGKPYNKQAIADMVMHTARSFTLDQNSWFCDELNYCIYQQAGVLLLNTQNPLSLSPQEEMLSPYFKPCELPKYGT